MLLCVRYLVPGVLEDNVLPFFSRTWFEGTVPRGPICLSEFQTFWCNCSSGCLILWVLLSTCVCLRGMFCTLEYTRGSGLQLPALLPSGLLPCAFRLRRAALLFRGQTHPVQLHLIFVLSNYSLPAFFSQCFQFILPSSLGSVFKGTHWVFWALLFLLLS